MNHDYNRHNKTDNVKWIITFIAIAILSVFVLAANTNGFTTLNPYGWFDSESEISENLDSANIEIKSEAGLEIHNSKFMRLSAVSTSVATPMAASAKSSAVTLTATILPATTTDKTVDWSVEFVDPSSSWASGKSASDYVSVVTTSDGALTATVSAIKGFGEQIKIVVTARSNTEVSAYCLVDYGQRLSDTATMTFSNTMLASNSSLTSDGIQQVEAMKTGNWQAMNAAYGRSTYTYAPSYKNDYTIANSNASTTIYVKASNSFYNALQAKGIAKDANTWVAVTTGTIGEIYEALCSVQLVPADGLSTTPLDNVTKYNEAILASTDTYDFEIKISVSTTYETKDYIIQCQFNRNGSAFSATEVSLSAESIVL